MIRVAIVDDESSERKTLCTFYEQLQREIQEEFKVTEYNSGEALLNRYEGNFDLICLDIDMTGKDGINIAREIRKTDSEVLIIFITNMAQMAIKGYEVRALDFIVKPVNYYSFAMKIKNAVNMIRIKQSRNIVISTPNGMQKISTDDLWFAEVSGHYLFFHTKIGVFRQKASLKELEERLEGLSFKRCNNCYLVNLRYVDCVNKDDLSIGGEWLKISRPRKKDFLQALANYMGGISV